VPPRDETQPELGEAVRRLREERGLTQEQLAHAADVHATWISRLENGHLNPAWGSMRRVAAALGMKLSELTAAAERDDGSGV
jgi:transcriptional regulator with XRE-family HTH domain